MTDEQRQEIMRRHNEGMRPMSEAMMAIRAAEHSEGMRQRGPLTSGEQEAINNFWRQSMDAMPIAQWPPKPPLTLRARLMRWIRA